MADVLGGLLAGFGAGRANNANRAKARAKAEQAQFDNSMKLASESRLLQSNAEDAFNNMKSRIEDPNWDPSMVPSLLAEAGRFDRTYGPSWKGGSAQSYFIKALHMQGSNPQAEGKQGPVEPPNMRGPIAGFTSKLQKDKAEQLARKERTNQHLSGVQADAVQYAMKGATGPDGLVDSDVVSRRLLEFQVNEIKKYDLTPKEILPLMADLRSQMAELYAPIALTPEQQTARTKEIDARTTKTTKMIDDFFLKKDPGGFAFVSEESTPIRNQMKSLANSMILGGDNLAQIREELIQVYANDDGSWPDGGEVVPYHAIIKKALTRAPQLTELTRRFYETPGIDVEDWILTYDEPSGTAMMTNKVTGEHEMLINQIPFRSEGDPDASSMPPTPPAGFSPPRRNNGEASSQKRVGRASQKAPASAPGSGSYIKSIGNLKARR